MSIDPSASIISIKQQEPIVMEATATTPRYNKRSILNAVDNNGVDSHSHKKSRATPVSEDSKIKGLRHFSLKVCKKVEAKQLTSYNEVADELVKEFMAEKDTIDSEDVQNNQSGKKVASRKMNLTIDEKNIRRRVYDALNVLMAMDIISKEKKEIRWRGFPTNGNNDFDQLEKERISLLKRIESKKEYLQELLIQNICFRNLTERNRYDAEMKTNSFNTTTPPSVTEKIYLPFIVVHTSPTAVINCDMNTDRTDVRFDFDMPFEMNDDNEVLKRSGFCQTSMEDLLSFLPNDLVHYCRDSKLLDSMLVPHENLARLRRRSAPIPRMTESQHHPLTHNNTLFYPYPMQDRNPSFRQGHGPVYHPPSNSGERHHFLNHLFPPAL